MEFIGLHLGHLNSSDYIGFTVVGKRRITEYGVVLVALTSSRDSIGISKSSSAPIEAENPSDLESSRTKVQEADKKAEIENRKTRKKCR
mgnify:CR=1 FL=1